MPKGKYIRTDKHKEINRLSMIKVAKLGKGKKRLPFSKKWKEKMSKTRIGTYMTEEAKEKLRKWTGGKRYNYIKDRSKLKKHPRKDLDTQYKYWVKEVRKIDKWKCRLLSNDCKGRLETHHIFNWVDYPELRYIITNGITLCAFHHPRGRGEEKRMIPIFQELLSVSKE